jgi:type I restriction enzyme R subunit
MTGAETILWNQLRNRGCDGFKFRRQTPLCGAVVDFFCAELKLVIELDGGIHGIKADSDSLRDARLTNAGFCVLRFRNQAFLNNPNVVLDAIRGHAAEMLIQPPHPTGSAGHLLPRGEKDL